VSRRWRVTRRQRPVKGGRLPLPSCVIKDIHREVEKRAHQYGVSKSFVIAVALADAFGIKEQETFFDTPRLKVVARR
jgi:hypothetical protein